MLYFGTSGFSYDDWADIIYPRGLPRQDWLRFYAREFNALELNSTYYALPRLSTIQSMISKTGDGFLFSVKAHQEMTHQRRNNSAVFTAFRVALEPFIASGRLGCVLAQFPYSFHCTRENQNYLKFFQESLGCLPIVIEFRNARWLQPGVFDWLRANNLGFCCVDEPQLPNLLPPIAEVTSDIGYVRFHGRNAARWWEHEQAYERYDYSYAEPELQEWVPKIKKVADTAGKTFIFANNHWKGQAVNTIRQLRTMFD